MMKASKHIDRFPSVQLVDLDLFLSDGVGTRGPNQQAMANCQMLEIMDASKAPIVTTGIPGRPFPEAFEGPRILGESPKSLVSESPNSPLSAFSSFESAPSCEGTAAELRSARILGPEQVTVVDSASVDDSQVRRSLRNHGMDAKQPAGKRKVGRPIAYCGDPNSPELTQAERRRIMRRIANRESARRVRVRRIDLLDDMAKQAKGMEEANARLLERLARVESNHNAVLSEAQALDRDLRSKSAQNEMLQAQVVQMRASLPLKAKGGNAPQVLQTSSRDSDCSFTSFADMGHVSGGGMPSAAPFGYLSGVADTALPQLEPIEQSFSEYLKNDFANGGNAA